MASNAVSTTGESSTDHPPSNWHPSPSPSPPILKKIESRIKACFPSAFLDDKHIRRAVVDFLSDTTPLHPSLVIYAASSPTTDNKSSVLVASTTAPPFLTGRCLYFCNASTASSLPLQEDQIIIAETTLESLPRIISYLSATSTDTSTSGTTATTNTTTTTASTTVAKIHMESTAFGWISMVESTLLISMDDSNSASTQTTTRSFQEVVAWCRHRSDTLVSLSHQLQQQIVVDLYNGLLSIGSISIADRLKAAWQRVDAGAEQWHHILHAVTTFFPSSDPPPQLHTETSITTCIQRVHAAYTECKSVPVGALIQSLVHDVVASISTHFDVKYQSMESLRAVLCLLGHIKSAFFDTFSETAAATVNTPTSFSQTPFFNTLNAYILRFQDFHTVIATTNHYAVLSTIHVGGPWGHQLTTTARTLYAEYQSVYTQFINAVATDNSLFSLIGDCAINPTMDAFTTHFEEWKHLVVHHLNLRLAGLLAHALDFSPRTIESMYTIFESFGPGVLQLPGVKPVVERRQREVVNRVMKHEVRRVASSVDALNCTGSRTTTHYTGIVPLDRIVHLKTLQNRIVRPIHVVLKNSKDTLPDVLEPAIQQMHSNVVHSIVRAYHEACQVGDSDLKEDERKRQQLVISIHQQQQEQ